MDALGKSLEDAEFKVKSNDNNSILKATMYWYFCLGKDSMEIVFLASLIFTMS